MVAARACGITFEASSSEEMFDATCATANTHVEVIQIFSEVMDSF